MKNEETPVLTDEDVYAMLSLRIVKMANILISLNDRLDYSVTPKSIVIPETKSRFEEITDLGNQVMSIIGYLDESE